MFVNLIILSQVKPAPTITEYWEQSPEYVRNFQGWSNALGCLNLNNH